jgi:hypothetical protein
MSAREWYLLGQEVEGVIVGLMAATKLEGERKE